MGVSPTSWLVAWLCLFSTLQVALGNQAPASEEAETVKPLEVNGIVNQEDINRFRAQISILLNTIGEDIVTLNHMRVADPTYYKKHFLADGLLGRKVVNKAAGIGVSVAIGVFNPVLANAYSITSEIMSNSVDVSHELASERQFEEDRARLFAGRLHEAPLRIGRGFTMAQLASAYEEMWSDIQKGNNTYLNEMKDAMSEIIEAGNAKRNGIKTVNTGVGAGVGRLLFHGVMAGVDVLTLGATLPVHVGIAAADGIQRAATKFYTDSIDAVQLKSFIWALWQVESSFRGKTQALNSIVRFQGCDITSKDPELQCHPLDWCKREWAFFPSDPKLFERTEYNPRGVCVPRMQRAHTEHGGPCFRQSMCKSSYCHFPRGKVEFNPTFGFRSQKIIAWTKTKSPASDWERERGRDAPDFEDVVPSSFAQLLEGECLPAIRSYIKGEFTAGAVEAGEVFEKPPQLKRMMTQVFRSVPIGRVGQPLVHYHRLFRSGSELQKLQEGDEPERAFVKDPRVLNALINRNRRNARVGGEVASSASEETATSSGEEERPSTSLRFNPNSQIRFNYGDEDAQYK